MKSNNLLIIGLSSVILTSLLFAVDTISPVDFTKYPLSKGLTAQSRGGTLPDKVAATDGMGLVVLVPLDKDKDKLKNDAYNKVIYSNLNKLDNNNSINDLIKEDKINIDQKLLEKTNSNEFQQTTIPNAAGKTENLWYSAILHTEYTRLKYAINKANNVCDSLGDGWRLPTLDESKDNYILTNNINTLTSTIKVYRGNKCATFFKYDSNQNYSIKGLWLGGSYSGKYQVICVKDIQ